MMFEIGATVFGLIQGILVMLNKRSNWIFYTLEMLFLILFSLINKLYGDVVNNSIYLIMGMIGFLLWNNDKETNKDIDKKTPALFLFVNGPKLPRISEPKKNLIYSPLGKHNPISITTAETINVKNNNFFIFFNL